MRTHTLTRALLERILVWGASLLVPLLPRRSILLAARVSGWCAYHVLRRYRDRALANLDLVFGDTMQRERKKAIARNAFRSFSLVILDLFWFSRRSARRIDRWVVFDPSFLPYFERNPLIAVPAHFGNWEVLGLATALRGCPAAVVAASTGSPAVDEVLVRMRRLTGQIVLPKDGAVRHLLRVLGDGGRVGVLIDQNVTPGNGGVFVEFFGRPVPVSPVVDILARRAGAPVLPIFCRLRSDGTYLAYGGRTIEPDRSGEDPTAITRDYLAVLEAEITASPGHWNWMYKRWKYIGPGETRRRYPYYARPADLGE
jgi:Kdo2-lipid IVA lauroyltransferase/acyltransferase